MSRIIRLIVLISLFLTSAMFSKGSDSISLHLEPVDSVVKAGDPVRVRITFTNTSDKPFVVVWTYDNRRPMTDQEKRTERQGLDELFKGLYENDSTESKAHLDSPSKNPPEKPIEISNRIEWANSWFFHRNGVLYAVLEDGNHTFKPKQDAELDTLITLYPGMHISEDVWVSPDARYGFNENASQQIIDRLGPPMACDLKIGKNRLQLVYYISPQQVKIIGERRHARRIAFRFPFVGNEPLLTGRIYSNPVTIEIVK